MNDNQTAWGRREAFVGLVLSTALAALYLPFLTKLVTDWGTNDDYSHGYFIPVLTIYFIYSIR
ncbi:archaeosortase/exosortase family protein, partial [bacterium]|nr:archaeosortase/exosortase family protein [bacterium]